MAKSSTLTSSPRSRRQGQKQPSNALSHYSAVSKSPRSPRSPSKKVQPPPVPSPEEDVADKKTEEMIERMRANLGRFARVSNKRMAIRTLEECKYLRSIPIQTTPASPNTPDEWELLESEVRWNSIQINGLLFQGSPNSQVLKVLRALCQELCKGLRISSESIYLAMVVRLANTTSSADSYFQLNTLFGSQDLVLQSPRDLVALPSTDLILYQQGGHLHGVLTSYIPYGLFRRTDVTSGRPWISLSARVHERVNLTTGMSVRELKAEVLQED